MLDPSQRASQTRRGLYRLHIERDGLVKDEMRLCARDPVHWVNFHCGTFDPQRQPSAIPFDLFPRQEQFLRWLQEREQRQESGIVEKSRETGVSYLCCAYALHRWLFRPGCVVCFASSKLELVDRRGDPKSLFHKIRSILYSLPWWMLPDGFDRAHHDNEAKLINPANESAVTGEGGDRIGMGGRATIYFVDEAAHLERPEIADIALSQTTRCRIDVSTPNGPGNPFAHKRFSGNLPVFTLHWKDDLRKNRTETLPDGRTIYPWYEAEKKRLSDPVIIASQLDIDYSASIEGIVIPAAWVRAAVGLDLPTGPRVVAGLDVGEEGPDPSVLVARAGPVVLPPISWGRCNTTETAWRARDEAVRLRVAAVCYDAGGVGAGVRGAWSTTERALPFEVIAVQFGGAPTEDWWPDHQTSRDKFLNLRAEMWWKLRARFERAYEFREKGVRHPPEDMISIPNHPQLIAELSLPLAERTETGKIKLESKQRMRARGVKSPDFADALALAFHARASEQWQPIHDRSALSVIARAPRGVFGAAADDDDDEDDADRRERE